MIIILFAGAHSAIAAIGDAPEDPLQEEGEESENETDDEEVPVINCHEPLDPAFDLASSPVDVEAAYLFSLELYTLELFCKFETVAISQGIPSSWGWFWCP